MAAVMSIMCTWKVPGVRDSIFYKNKMYPAVKMEEGYSILKSKMCPHPILAVATQGKDMVMMTVPEKPLENFELLEYIDAIDNSATTNVTSDYDSARFPMV